jgi:hypothetical protein
MGYADLRVRQDSHCLATTEGRRRLSPKPAGRSKMAKPSCASGRIRTCDPRLRSSQEGDNVGQRETAAPMFPAFFDHPRQLENASNRHRLSAVCQSNRKPKKTRESARGS